METKKSQTLRITPNFKRYFNEQRSILKSKFPFLTDSQRKKRITEQWNSMSLEMKLNYSVKPVTPARRALKDKFSSKFSHESKFFNKQPKCLTASPGTVTKSKMDPPCTYGISKDQNLYKIKASEPVREPTGLFEEPHTQSKDTSVTKSKYTVFNRKTENVNQKYHVPGPDDNKPPKSATQENPCKKSTSSDPNQILSLKTQLKYDENGNEIDKFGTETFENASNDFNNNTEDSSEQIGKIMTVVMNNAPSNEFEMSNQRNITIESQKMEAPVSQKSYTKCEMIPQNNTNDINKNIDNSNGDDVIDESRATGHPIIPHITENITHNGLPLNANRTPDDIQGVNSAKLKSYLTASNGNTDMINKLARNTTNNLIEKDTMNATDNTEELNTDGITELAQNVTNIHDDVTKQTVQQTADEDSESSASSQEILFKTQQNTKTYNDGGAQHRHVQNYTAPEVFQTEIDSIASLISILKRSVNKPKRRNPKASKKKVTFPDLPLLSPPGGTTANSPSKTEPGRRKVPVTPILGILNTASLNSPLYRSPICKTRSKTKALAEFNGTWGDTNTPVIVDTLDLSKMRLLRKSPKRKAIETIPEECEEDPIPTKTTKLEATNSKNQPADINVGKPPIVKNNMRRGKTRITRSKRQAMTGNPYPNKENLPNQNKTVSFKNTVREISLNQTKNPSQEHEISNVMQMNKKATPLTTQPEGTSRDKSTVTERATVTARKGMVNIKEIGTPTRGIRWNVRKSPSIKYIEPDSDDEDLGDSSLAERDQSDNDESRSKIGNIKENIRIDNEQDEKSIENKVDRENEEKKVQEEGIESEENKMENIESGEEEDLKIEEQEECVDTKKDNNMENTQKSVHTKTHDLLKLSNNNEHKSMNSQPQMTIVENMDMNKTPMENDDPFSPFEKINDDTKIDEEKGVQPSVDQEEKFDKDDKFRDTLTEDRILVAQNKGSPDENDQLNEVLNAISQSNTETEDQCSINEIIHHEDQENEEYVELDENTILQSPTKGADDNAIQPSESAQLQTVSFFPKEGNGNYISSLDKANMQLKNFKEDTTPDLSIFDFQGDLSQENKIPAQNAIQKRLQYDNAVKKDKQNPLSPNPKNQIIETKSENSNCPVEDAFKENIAHEDNVNDDYSQDSDEDDVLVIHRDDTQQPNPKANEPLNAETENAEDKNEIDENEINRLEIESRNGNLDEVNRSKPNGTIEDKLKHEFMKTSEPQNKEADRQPNDSSQDSDDFEFLHRDDPWSQSQSQSQQSQMNSKINHPQMDALEGNDNVQVDDDGLVEEDNAQDDCPPIYSPDSMSQDAELLYHPDTSSRSDSQIGQKSENTLNDNVAAPAPVGDQETVQRTPIIQHHLINGSIETPQQLPGNLAGGQQNQPIETPVMSSTHPDLITPQMLEGLIEANLKKVNKTPKKRKAIRKPAKKRTKIDVENIGKDNNGEPDKYEASDNEQSTIDGNLVLERKPPSGRKRIRNNSEPSSFTPGHFKVKLTPNKNRNLTPSRQRILTPNAPSPGQQLLSLQRSGSTPQSDSKQPPVINTKPESRSRLSFETNTTTSTPSICTLTPKSQASQPMSELDLLSDTKNADMWQSDSEPSKTTSQETEPLDDSQAVNNEAPYKDLLDIFEDSEEDFVMSQKVVSHRALDKALRGMQRIVNTTQSPLDTDIEEKYEDSPDLSGVSQLSDSSSGIGPCNQQHYTTGGALCHSITGTLQHNITGALQDNTTVDPLHNITGDRLPLGKAKKGQQNKRNNKDKDSSHQNQQCEDHYEFQDDNYGLEHKHLVKTHHVDNEPMNRVSVITQRKMDKQKKESSGLIKNTHSTGTDKYAPGHNPTAGSNKCSAGPGKHKTGQYKCPSGQKITKSEAFRSTLKCNSALPSPVYPDLIIQVDGVMKLSSLRDKDDLDNNEDNSSLDDVSGDDSDAEAAQNDHSLNAQNDHSINSQNDHSINSQNDHSINSQNDHSINSQNNHSINAQNDHSINAQNNHSIKAQNDHSINAQNDHSLSAQNDHSINAQNNHSINAQNNHSLSAQNDHSINAQNNHSINAQNNHSLSAQNDHSLSAQIDRSLNTHNDTFLPVPPRSEGSPVLARRQSNMGELCDLFGEITPPDTQWRKPTTRRVTTSMPVATTSNFEEMFEADDIFM